MNEEAPTKRNQDKCPVTPLMRSSCGLAGFQSFNGFRQLFSNTANSRASSSLTASPAPGGWITSRDSDGLSGASARFSA